MNFLGITVGFLMILIILTYSHLEIYVGEKIGQEQYNSLFQEILKTRNTNTKKAFKGSKNSDKNKPIEISETDFKKVVRALIRTHYTSIDKFKNLSLSEDKILNGLVKISNQKFEIKSTHAPKGTNLGKTPFDDQATKDAFYSMLIGQQKTSYEQPFPAFEKMLGQTTSGILYIRKTKLVLPTIKSELPELTPLLDL